MTVRMVFRAGALLVGLVFVANACSSASDSTSLSPSLSTAPSTSTGIAEVPSESPEADERVVALIEDRFGRTLTATELAELRARVAVMDTLASCDEFVEYSIETSVGLVTAVSREEVVEEALEEGAILAIGVAEYSDGTASAFFDNCDPDLGLDFAATSHGDEPSLDLLWDECESGLFESCDLLYMHGPPNSDYESFAVSCGDRGPAQEEYCLITHGDGVAIDSWHERCRSNDFAACDLLYQFSPVGSEDERLAKRCGGIAEEKDVPCIVRFGL